MIYLDNNSTTVIDREVAECLSDAFGQGYCNPSSQHQFGRLARRYLEQSREDILRRIGGKIDGMSADRLIFTSGGTESNNLALRGLSAKRPGAVVVSAIEHPSILEVARAMIREGRRVLFLPVESSGIVSIKRLEQLLDAHRQAKVGGGTGTATAESDGLISVVSIMLANNETGIIQPLQEIARLCHEAGVLLHTDAVQGLGKIELSLGRLGVDAMSLAAHKVHGPIGIGGLVLRHSVQCEPIVYGGFQQEGLRSGTESVVLAAGFAKTIEIADRERMKSTSNIEKLRDEFEREVVRRLPDVKIVGDDQLRLPNTSCIAVMGCDRQSLQMALDLRGLACSTGSACASGSSQPSHVLQAMGLDSSIVQSAIRISLSKWTTEQDVRSAVQILEETARSLRGSTWSISSKSTK